MQRYAPLLLVGVVVLALGVIVIPRLGPDKVVIEAPDEVNDPVAVDDGHAHEEAPATQKAAEELVIDVPEVSVSLPKRVGKTTRPTQLPLDVFRERLNRVLQEHARSVDNPWAVGHALLAMGPDVTLDDGRPAIATMFETYTERLVLGEDTFTVFQRNVGDIRVEPHTDLMLKAFAETGIAPSTPVTVDGQATTLASLVRGSAARVWVRDGAVAGRKDSDSPWSLQGLTSWVDPSESFSWQVNGLQIDLDKYTSAVVADLKRQTVDLKSAKLKGDPVSKRDFQRKGLFSYACGGQHHLQGAAYAVARGYGTPQDAEEIERQIDLLYWRLDLELASVDEALSQVGEGTPLALILLSQRLKFLGHFVESAHKFAALGLSELNDERFATVERATAELLRTIRVMDEARYFDNLDFIRTNPEINRVRSSEQVYLDLIGDSAHALRGLDLASGKGTIRF